MAKVINIKWETDGYEIDLPNEVTIPDCFMDSDAGPDVDAISDWLSNEQFARRTCICYCSKHEK